MTHFHYRLLAKHDFYTSAYIGIYRKLVLISQNQYTPYSIARTCMYSQYLHYR